MVADIRLIQEDDLCFNCKGHIHFEKGIEIGNTFKLGTKYAKAMDLQYLDQNNQLQDVWMGSYGIGPGRCMAAIAEQNNDDKGLIWPMSIAPYQVGIVIINTKEEKQVQVGSALYDQLQKLGIEVILDDREERAGVKFNDMDLIGVPFRVVVGKSIEKGMVEVKARTEKDSKEIEIDKVVEYIEELLKNSY
ncbi:Proline--tRNA ligase [bioreactor metagenome]|uniref:Proline--tRNA ligase n=1 Tax=bioreactor metagenome TaxID=1076179 RepID=A0A645I1Y0_9ZZZZ